MSEADLAKARADTVTQANADSTRWLSRTGLGRRQGEPMGDYLHRLAEYRDTLTTKPPPSTDWARKVLADYQAGTPTPTAVRDFAAAALGMRPEEVAEMRVEVEFGR